MKVRKQYTCPLEITHDIIKGKWKTIILWLLRNGPMSLSNLKNSIEGITQKMLIEQLKELKDFGLINKKVYDGYPLKVEYSLTSGDGEKILKALTIMQEIGITYMLNNGLENELKVKGIIK